LDCVEEGKWGEKSHWVTGGGNREYAIAGGTGEVIFIYIHSEGGRKG